MLHWVRVIQLRVCMRRCARFRQGISPVRVAGRDAEHDDRSVADVGACTPWPVAVYEPEGGAARQVRYELFWVRFGKWLAIGFVDNTVPH